MQVKHDKLSTHGDKDGDDDDYDDGRGGSGDDGNKTVV